MFSLDLLFIHLWSIFRKTHQRSRHIYDLYYKKKEINIELYDFCVDAKLVDALLIAKWKKQGYAALDVLRHVIQIDRKLNLKDLLNVLYVEGLQDKLNYTVFIIVPMFKTILYFAIIFFFSNKHQ